MKKLTKKITITFALLFILFCSFGPEVSTAMAKGVKFEQSDMLQNGVKPGFGVSFGDFFDQYNVPINILVYARGFYWLNIFNSHYIYPEFRIGWIYLIHKDEDNRHLTLIPIQFNFIWDWTFLHFKVPIGTFTLKPFVGYGMYYAMYTSDRKSVKGLDHGYQVGANLEYTNKVIENFYLEFSIEQYLIGERDELLSGFNFTIGAGYTFKLGKPSKEQLEYSKKRKKYLKDLMGKDEKKIINASKWLGNRREEKAIPRLTELLLKHKRAKVRRNAATALGVMGNKKSILPLTDSATGDKSLSVRRAAIRAISIIGPVKGKGVVEKLEKANKGKKDRTINDLIKELKKK